MMIDDECGAVGGIIGRGNRSTRRKPAPVPLCPLQIPHDLTRVRTRATVELTALWRLGGGSPPILNLGISDEKLVSLSYRFRRITGLFNYAWKSLKLTTHLQLLPRSVSRLSRQRGTLNIYQPHKPPRPVTAIALFTFLWQSILWRLRHYIPPKRW
jgi:hypothetical protein